MIGFIGLGQIGAPMATRLANAKDGLIVYDLRPEAVQPLVDAGASPAATIEDVARNADLICVMVRDDDQVAEVVSAIAAAQPAHPDRYHRRDPLHDPGRHRPRARRRIRQDQLQILDAPVSGGFMGAQDGRPR